MFPSRWTARRRGRGSWVSKGIGAQGTSLHALQGDQAQLVPQQCDSFLQYKYLNLEGYAARAAEETQVLTE